MKHRLIAVAAVARNGVIGSGNSLPWRLSSDLKRFKAITMGKPLIMGRRTWDSVGRPLPGRKTVVLTRDAGFGAEGALAARTPQEAVALAGELADEMGVSEIIVAGGGEIYAALLDETDAVELTEIELDAAGDAFFPRLDPAQWVEIRRERAERGLRDDADFTYVTLERRRE
jgi:dihydrofolate reductase